MGNSQNIYSALCRSYIRKYGEKETFSRKVIVAISLLPALGQKRVLFWDDSGEALVFKVFFFPFSVCARAYVYVCVVSLEFLFSSPPTPIPL